MAEESETDLSVGCRCCQRGTWLCIFLTYLCGGGCHFCPAPHRQVDKTASALGDDPRQILHHLNRMKFEGIGFSGGDCFLVFDRLVEWLSFFRNHRPDLYYWCYTNGMSATKNQLKELAGRGMQEIRFNIAASGYQHPRILSAIQSAVHFFPHVAVEIPSIPEDFEKLIPVLTDLDRIGVEYLNLHEYILVQEALKTKYTAVGTFVLNLREEIRYDQQSLNNTRRIIGYCRQESLRIKINDCSLLKKEKQLLQRRLVMGGLLKERHERITEDGLLETIMLVPENSNDSSDKDILYIEENWNRPGARFLHPHETDMHSLIGGKKAYRLSLVPSLDLVNIKKLWRIERIESHAESHPDQPLP